MSFFSENYIRDLIEILNIFPHDKFELLISALVHAYDKNRKVFVMGNGGSGATASHWVCDINKGCSLNHNKRFKMICLNDNIATILAYANDLSYNEIFIEQMRNFFSPGDVVIGISGSGNSVNVLKAIEYAVNNQGITIGLCGFDGGKLYHMVDIPIRIEINDMQKVEDIHTIITHMAMQRICQVLDRRRPLELFREATAQV
jgi:D-sedoheptulose 7-phosphate isomerase